MEFGLKTFDVVIMVEGNGTGTIVESTIAMFNPEIQNKIILFVKTSENVLEKISVCNNHYVYFPIKHTYENEEDLIKQAYLFSPNTNSVSACL